MDNRHNIIFINLFISYIIIRLFEGHYVITMLVFYIVKLLDRKCISAYLPRLHILASFCELPTCS